MFHWLQLSNTLTQFFGKNGKTLDEPGPPGRCGWGQLSLRYVEVTGQCWSSVNLEVWVMYAMWTASSVHYTWVAPFSLILVWSMENVWWVGIERMVSQCWRASGWFGSKTVRPSLWKSKVTKEPSSLRDDFSADLATSNLASTYTSHFLLFQSRGAIVNAPSSRICLFSVQERRHLLSW